MEPMSVTEIIKLAGGAHKIAEAVGCNRTTPYSWTTGVPPKYVRAIAELIQLQPSVIRPDIFGEPD